MHPTRRQFLAWSAAAAAATLVPRPLADEPATTELGPLKLGFSLYGMKRLSLADALENCARIGYGNVELCLNPGFPSEPSRFPKAERKAVARLSRNLGLSISSAIKDMHLFANAAGHSANLESIKLAAAVLHETEAEPTAPIDSILGGKPRDWEAEKERAAERLRDWGETAGAEGVTIVVKGHAGEAADTPVKLRWLVERAGSLHVRVDFDQSHYGLSGIPIEEGLHVLKPYMRLVHLKDATGTPTAPHFLLPGDGGTDFTRYCRLLRGVGYSGAVIALVSAQIFLAPGYDPVAAAQRCYRALAGPVAEADL